MFENNSEEIRQIVQKAKDEDDRAKEAKDVVNDAISEMSPQRQYNKDKSQNKR